MKNFSQLFVIAVLMFTALFVPTHAFAQEATAAVAPTPDVKSALLSAFIQYVLPVLATGLSALLAWVFVQLGKKYGADATGSKKSQVLNHLFTLAQSVVADLEATLKPQLLAATADGVLTPVEVGLLRDSALNRLKFLAGEKGLAEAQFLLGMTGGALEGFLMGLIEKAVDGQPAKAVPAPTATHLEQQLATVAAGNPS